jgi:hypothetical protein
MSTSKNQPKTGNQFKPGNQFGKGRPAGSRNSATLALQVLLDGEGEEITRRAIELAIAGNEVALRLCMERLIPIRKDRPVSVKLPSVATAKGIAEALDAVLKQVSAGNLTPMEAATLAGILDGRRRVIEVVEHEERLQQLEEANAGKKH